jgi:hypothetical protein
VGRAEGRSPALRALQRIGLEQGDFEGPRYRRIDQIRNLMAAGDLAADLRWNTAA